MHLSLGLRCRDPKESEAKMRGGLPVGFSGSLQISFHQGGPCLLKLTHAATNSSFANRRLLRGTIMQLSGFRAALMALTVTLTGFGLAPAAHADGGSISFTVLKGGWVIGASGGNGTLVFHGRRYPISIGGLSAGFVFGASETFFHGSVSNIRGPGDVAGVYGAAGAGAAVGAGAQFITLTNEKGAILTLTGRQVGLQINADLSGLSISVH